ncbi:PKD domain-containing protein [Exilibacterium tricleocarpae]|uniref:Glucanase n=1 Tax=Exilibacterium tricleocarpae TaxID=2591008 RepID=A0A545SSW8_9GAMM|nr:glycoside hydrolase family 6 protein [Exilibacterium tricleocarpae]TQV68047.1 PKD domain-containing protein [Exilibacterium tricleocarpae]
MTTFTETLCRRWLALGVGLVTLYAPWSHAAVCQYRVDNEWNNGFVATISITNDTAAAIDGWEVNWEYSGDNRVSNGWNANISGANPYNATGLSWNGNIGAGQTVSFGFQGSKGAAPAQVPEVTGAVCSGNLAPVAVAAANPLQGDAPLTVGFDASGSSDPDGDVSGLTFSWSFGDGSSATGALVNHTYTEAGVYTATLTVSDGQADDTASVVITVNGNLAPVAVATASTSNGPAPLAVSFNGSASSDPDNGPDPLTYLWLFGDGEQSTAVSPAHTFSQNGVYTVTLTVSDGEAEDTATLTVVVGDTPVRVDNPFRDVDYYIDPLWSARAAAEPGGAAIAQYNTAVWMDRIGAITDGIGLRGHLDEALSQNAGMFMFVVYDLPNRDCAALASSGELRISENGFQRYQDEYIASIVEVVSDPKYAGIRIVAIIEVDSLPNLVTNLSVPDCAEADGPGGYRDGIRHALNQLAPLENVYPYLDIAHSGWLGWSSNFGPAVNLIADVIESTDAGWGSVAGFATNSANYTPTVEPFLPDPNLSVAGLPVRSADFYEWNDYFEEKAYAQDWREAMIARGAPATIGMLIDTGRNGWGGPERPTQVSTATDINTYINESRVDRRLHRGNWCNQPGGVGFKPWADPYEGIDAFVWIKPQGESDGISDPNFEPDPNDPAKRHDPMCDPTAPSRDNPAVTTGALANAPHAGRWFPEAFAVLLNNAYPPAQDPAGPPPPPLPPRSNCPGLDPNQPVLIDQPGVRVPIDLGCQAPIHVQFGEAIPNNLYVENTGDAFDVTLEHAGGSDNASGHFSSVGLAGADQVKVIRNGAAASIELRYD